MVFVKGQSGNPSGGHRPGLPKLAAEKFLPHIEAAVRALVESLDDPDKRVQAAREILDRVYGKPKQAVDVDAGEGGPLAAILKVVQSAAEKK